jgi:hypothetical protein
LTGGEMAIKWRRNGEYFVTCGTHNISKATVNGEAIYQLWELSKIKYGQHKLIGLFDDSDSAKIAHLKIQKKEST